MSPTNRHQLSPNQKRSGVFISYARSDGSEFANQLRQLLERQNIPLWQDRTGMEGGRDWWQQITEALDKVSFLLLVVTPNALKSKIVRDEWRYARQQGVCVYPIKGSPDIDYDSMPRWMRDAAFYDLGTLANGDFSHEWPKFLNDLQKTPDVRRVPFMVEDLPANHVHRSQEFDQLIALLLDRTHEEPVAITAALRGAGGYGKTTIAKSLCHNEDIQDAFDDGILWVTLGETPGDLTGRVEDLIQTISGERPGFSNLEAAITRFTELLADRDILLVIDDVWNRDHLRPFLQGGKRCARLITTRNLDTLPPQAQPVKVDAMRAAEAVKMLSVGLPTGETGTCDGELMKLAIRLGEWPLLLGLAGAALQDRVLNTNQPLPEAIAYINRALDRRGLTFFDARDTESRNQAVAKTIGVSLDLLKANERARYDELAVFPEDVNIPLSTLGKFWASTGATEDFDAEFDTEELCTRMNRLSLLHTFDSKARYIRLHDVVRHYLMHAQRDRLPTLHSQLLDAHRPLSSPLDSHFSPWSALPEDDPYFWDHLAFHLIEAGLGSELVVTVTDWQYLAQKILLRKTHLVETDLLKAMEFVPANDPLRTLWRGIAGSSHLLNHCKTKKEIEATAFARLQHLADLSLWLENIAPHLDRPLVSPKENIPLPDSPQPALIRTLEGHSNRVSGCAFSPDGKLIVSASDDKTLKVWDAITGQALRTLQGHLNRVTGCAFSPDGKLIVSASDDKTLKVWDAITGQALRTLQGHSASVTGFAFSPDDKLVVSASADKTLKVWDPVTGQAMGTLKGHSNRVSGCAFSPDGKLIVSASFDKTLKVWDAITGQALRTLQGHSNRVTGCAFTPNGKLIVSASGDQTLKVWDAVTGQALRTLEGHSNSVTVCAFSPDGKLIVSASDDRTLKVWDAITGRALRTLQGHSESVLCCAFSPDGKLIVSASDDRTLQVWDAMTEQAPRTLQGHSNRVTGCAFSPDGKLIVSASDDQTLKVWDAVTGQVLRAPEGHSNRVTGCAFSPDGKLIVSASDDRTLKVWDAITGQALRTLQGHSEPVTGCAFSPDGKLIISASMGEPLKVWDAITGLALRTLQGHSESVTGFAFSPDGKLVVSASADQTLKVWDAITGQGLRTFELEGRLDFDASWGSLFGFGGRVSVIGCAFSPDGKRIVSASDDKTLKVWDAITGQALRTLQGHSASVTGFAFSPDGKLIVSASTDRTLKVWDAITGQALRTLEGHSNRVTGCAFNPDGKLIVSASSDSTLKVWDAITGQMLATFYADGSMLCCAVCGEWIVAGGDRGLYFLRLVQ